MKTKKLAKNCSIIKVVDSRSVGNRDKIVSKVHKKGLTDLEADALANKLNAKHEWMWPETTYYVLEVKRNKKAA